MKLLALKRLERVPHTANEYKDAGDFLLNADHISAMIPDGPCMTLVCMNNGVMYQTPHTLLEITNEMREQLCSA
jgi:hypothetical protein